jgi:vanillate O-demethylase monooxygenase subunit
MVSLDDPEWTVRHGSLEYEADYMLINDNLLDFSHLSYVHAGSFGSGSGWAETRPDVQVVERGVRIQRWLESQPRSNSRPDIEARLVDHWSSYDYFVPGALHSVAYSYPVGTARALDYGSPSGTDALYGTITSQAVTPIEEGRCRYFFSRGMPRAHATDEVLSTMMAVTEAAFEEDREIIEAQQKVLDETSHEEKMFVTTADKALVLFRRLMARRLKEEAAAAGTASKQRVTAGRAAGEVVGAVK